jgi:hypothetical protein
VRGVDGASWNNKRPAGVALSFQVRKHIVEAHADVPRNILSTYPSGPEFSHEPTKFRPEVAVIFLASALPGCGEWLARSRVSAANNVNCCSRGYLFTSFRFVVLVPFVVAGLAEPSDIKWLSIVVMVRMNGISSVFCGSFITTLLAGLGLQAPALDFFSYYFLCFPLCFRWWVISKEMIFLTDAFLLAELNAAPF